MENILKNGLSIQNLLDWNLNKEVNPRSQRKISKEGITYKNYLKTYQKIFPNNYNFFDAENKDPVSLEIIWEERNNKKIFIYPDYKNLILYKDENNMINCFEKVTINDFITHKIKVHPTTFAEIPDDILKSIDYKLVEIKKTVRERALEVFQIFLNLSIFIDREDFLNLNNNQLDKLYYETFDFFIQNLNENLINNIKEFGKTKNKYIYNFTVNEFSNFDVEKKQTILLDSFDILLSYEDEQIKSMSYYIILGGLSIVIPEIKKNYPDFSFSF